MALLNREFYRRERMRRRGWLKRAREFWDQWAQKPVVLFTAEDGRQVRCAPFLRPGALPSRGWTLFFPGGRVRSLDVAGRTLPSSLDVARMLERAGRPCPGFLAITVAV